VNTPSLLQTIYNNAPELLLQIEPFIDGGDDLDYVTEYDESPLRVASNNGRFDVVLRLLEAGALDYQLEWTDTVFELVRGSAIGLERKLKETACCELEIKDWWERTPLLIAIQMGDIQKVELLLKHGANRDAVGRCCKTPMQYAVENGHVQMLEWLVSRGFDIEATDQFGITPLVHAVERGRAGCVKYLLDAGAQIRAKSRGHFPLIYDATSLEIARLLVEHGECINDISWELHAKLTGTRHNEAPEVSREDYFRAKFREFGRHNAEETNRPFWLAMIRAGGSAWHATERFKDDNSVHGHPVWCYQRYGRSTTLMPDGRIIEIAGEHEDSYDPDFCIYNDVTVFDGKGGIRIFSYPMDVFPPTDFHSATLVGEFIYIIGNLGYQESRRPGFTPVYRLSTRTFKIEKVTTSGEMPGWINGHKASLNAHQEIVVVGGNEIVTGNNKKEYRLCLKSMTWSSCHPLDKAGSK